MHHLSLLYVNKETVEIWQLENTCTVHYMRKRIAFFFYILERRTPYLSFNWRLNFQLKNIGLLLPASLASQILYFENQLNWPYPPHTHTPLGTTVLGNCLHSRLLPTWPWVNSLPKMVYWLTYSKRKPTVSYVFCHVLNRRCSLLTQLLFTDRISDPKIVFISFLRRTRGWSF